MGEDRNILSSPGLLPVGEERSAVLLQSFLATGGEHDFGILAQEIAPRLLRYCRALGSSGADAEEVVQDVLYIVYRKAWMVRELGSFWPWLFRVTRNAQLQRVRRAKRELPSSSLEPFEQANLPARGDLSGPHRDLGFSEWMELLEPGERNVMVLRYVEDYEYHEIAQALAIPIGTVKSRLFQAKKKLSKRFSSLQTRQLEKVNATAGGQRGKK